MDEYDVKRRRRLFHLGAFKRTRRGTGLFLSLGL
jgi:hypothetical protein